VKKAGPVFDLPIAVALLVSSSQLVSTKLKDFVIIGELGLDGKIKAINGVLPILISARELGFKKFIVPKENENEASFIEGVEVFALSNLSEVVSFLAGSVQFECVKNRVWNGELSDKIVEDFSRVKGQKIAKRAIEIAVSGGHNILMVGPPGAGKTMIARCIPE
jgi:magnesium chelatase family protein